MNGFKSLFASKTFWGGLLAVGAGIGGFFGFVITEEDRTAVLELGVGIASFVGGIIAIYGRIKATKQIGDTDAEATGE